MNTDPAAAPPVGSRPGRLGLPWPTGTVFALEGQGVFLWRYSPAATRLGGSCKLPTGTLTGTTESERRVFRLAWREYTLPETIADWHRSGHMSMSMAGQSTYVELTNCQLECNSELPSAMIEIW